MKLTFLGTGNAGVTKYYNTCFLLEDPARQEDPFFLVDAGGGNGILRQLRKSKVRPGQIGTIFVTHRHLDHILGVFWLLRDRCQKLSRGEDTLPLVIYGNGEVTGILRDMTERLLVTREVPGFSERVRFTAVEDGETKEILGQSVTFFDIHSTKAAQSGFCLKTPGGAKLTYCGDEPCSSACESYAAGADLLIHEAFCLDADREIFHPYEKHHSTVKDACMLAERLSVKTLALVHTEEKTGKEREARYRKEGKQYFSGRLWIPEDLSAWDLAGILDGKES
ncbi:MAG: MBL fold metallo-hydrolase [Lachnospiraceae bacterium]